MEKKFTPGPWKADIVDNPFDPERKHSIDILATANADAYEWVASIHQQFKGRENGEANARLIAEAPTMYELLEKLDAATAYGDMDVSEVYKLGAIAKALFTRINNR